MRQPLHAGALPFGAEAGLPYSKGLMARALVATGVAPDKAYELARLVEIELPGQGGDSLDFERIQALAADVLGEADGAVAVNRLRNLRSLQELDVPIIVLIGGGTGTGKSTIATETAYRLGITRVTSTDFVRQTMRAFFSPEFMPSIHFSSFEAGSLLVDEPDPAVRGFLDQTRNVLVGVKAAMDRALHEGFSMVLEGVHLVPGMLTQPDTDALVVQCVLAIEDADEHAANFFTREAASEGLRPLEKYLASLPEIRRIQDFIVERAERAGVPVIDNASVDAAIGEVLELVFAGAERIGKVAAHDGNR
jgi:2-phosphoglycerate kinase